MTTQEFSNEFDVLYNNIMSNAAPGLNEYEKSVFLTHAQQEFVISMYSGKNQFRESFEASEEMRSYLESLIVLSELNTTSGTTMEDGNVLISLPSDVLFIIYESAESQTTSYNVKVITFDEYTKLKANPFKGPLSNRALRVTSGPALLEVVPPKNVTIISYKIKYLKNPTPIILTSLTEMGANIKGSDVEATCALHESTHLPILKLAVQLAAQAYKS